MSEVACVSSEHDYVSDLELRKRILIRKIELLLRHDQDVQKERDGFNSILQALQTETTLMEDGIISHAEMIIETLLLISNVPKNEAKAVSIECYLQYQYEIENRISSSSEETTPPHKTRSRFRRLFGFLKR
ncbi:hypothetical protein JXD20_04405 [Candidatus Peregrinibacteria bacterium]|nr:hypothetical protein [Candidatus Peregrinibacteria bacterium]